jgi:hypothetical protein
MENNIKKWFNYFVHDTEQKTAPLDYKTEILKAALPPESPYCSAYQSVVHIILMVHDSLPNCPQYYIAHRVL